MIFGMIGLVIFNLVDTFYVGRLGTNELAALSFTFPVILIINSLALGLGVGVSSIISRAVGEGDHYKVQRFATDSLSLAFLLVVIFITEGTLCHILFMDMRMTGMVVVKPRGMGIYPGCT